MTANDDRPIKGWVVQATCPSCGGVLSHVADGVPGGNVSRAIVRCTSCGRTFAVQITVTDASAELGRRRAPHPDGCTCIPCQRALARARREGAA